MPRVHRIERESMIVGSSSDASRVASRAEGVISYILGVVELFLAFRFLFLLFGANQGNVFVSFIYSLTGPLVAPFRGIFSNIQDGVAVFDWSTIVAMIVYVVIAYIVIDLFFVDRSDDEEVL